MIQKGLVDGRSTAPIDIAVPPPSEEFDKQK
jgi:hypothetical protein